MTLPSIAMQNAMACRVFRILRIMASEEDQFSLTPDVHKSNLPETLTSIIFIDPRCKLAALLVCHVQRVGKESRLARTV